MLYDGNSLKLEGNKYKKYWALVIGEQKRFGNGKPRQRWIL
jgi:hypothetical protein